MSMSSTPSVGASASGRPTSRTGGGPSGPRRRPAGAPRRRNASQSTPRVPEPSALDRMLDAAAAQPQPTPPSFRGFGLSESLVVTLERRGITVPSPIQARSLPDALAGRDILGRAQTGSGKTLAFGIPLLTNLAGGAKARPNRPAGLILVPTRELAEQVKDALAPLAHTLDRTVTAVYGGASIARQVDALNRGADVVVATPGRLEDLIARKSCALGEVRVTVLDEADFMADLGFMPAVTRILDQVRTGTQRLLFSATLDRGVDTLVKKYLVDPAVHAVASPAARIDSMDHLTFEVDSENKADVAAEVATRQGRTLFFVRTKHGADRLAKRLTRGGLSAGAIHGNLSQSQRQRALDAFAAGRVPVLVATDVAARGIHVDAVDLVVHYDPPADHKDYLHRSGRTARAGARGTVLSLVLSSERSAIAAIHRRLETGTTAVVVDPRHEAVRELASSGTPVIVTAEPVREPERAERPRYGRGGSGGSGGSGGRGRSQGGQAGGRPRTGGGSGAPIGSGRRPRTDARPQRSNG